jgi:hypothetical protein
MKNVVCWHMTPCGSGKKNRCAIWEDLDFCYPEYGGDICLRNVGSSDLHTESHMLEDNILHGNDPLDTTGCKEYLEWLLQKNSAPCGY